MRSAARNLRDEIARRRAAAARRAAPPASRPPPVAPRVAPPPAEPQPVLQEEPPPAEPDVSVWLPDGLTAAPAIGVEEEKAPAPISPDVWVVDTESPPTVSYAIPGRRGGEPRRWIALVAGVLVVAGGAAALLLTQDDDPADTPGTATSAPAQEPPPQTTPVPRPEPVLRPRVAVRELDGIPQVGSILGVDRDDLPILGVFAEVASPGYARFDAEVLPRLLSDEVRPGRLRVQLRTLPSDDALGNRATRLVQAAGLQTRLWPFVRALAAISHGDVVEADLARARRLAGGLQADRLETDSESQRVERAIARAAFLARVEKVAARPGFTVTIGTHTDRFAAPLDPDRFAAQLDAALERLRARIG